MLKFQLQSRFLHREIYTPIHRLKMSLANYYSTEISQELATIGLVAQQQTSRHNTFQDTQVMFQKFYLKISMASLLLKLLVLQLTMNYKQEQFNLNLLVFKHQAKLIMVKIIIGDCQALRIQLSKKISTTQVNFMMLSKLHYKVIILDFKALK